MVCSGRIAQLVEQLTLNQRVLGSSPSASTIVFPRKYPFSGWSKSAGWELSWEIPPSSPAS